MAVLRRLSLLLSVIALWTPVSLPVRAADPPFTRVSPTTLTLPDVAPAFGYVTRPALGGLIFDQPVAVVAAPGETNRLFIVEKTGRIMVVRDQSQPDAAEFLDLRSRVGDASGERGLLGLAFHPDFAANGTLFVWYTTETTSAAGPGLHNELARFRVSASDEDVADPTSWTPLITQRDEAANHNGGGLQFGPDGYLYLGLGDEGGSNDSFGNSQRIDGDFFSAILRIDVDRRAGSLEPTAHPAVHAGTYAIPPDNPFVGATSFNGLPVTTGTVRTELWAVGLRNPWRMAFDVSSGQLWVGDVGQDSQEEINLITRGGNYGWAYREGDEAGPRPSPPGGARFQPPVHAYLNSGSASVTGGLVYRDIQLSQIEGAYIFADSITGTISALRRSPDGGTVVRTLTTDAGITSFLVNPRDGHIIVTDLDEGLVKQLAYDSTAIGTPFPRTLSATGAFASLAPLTPGPGLVEYEPIVSFWSDHARKTRWVALTDDTSTFGFRPEGGWNLPVGAVWVKHFELELTRGDPSTARHVETRFLVKTADGVYGLSYQWNDAQTEATLVGETGASKSFTVVEDGVARNQSWRFPSRSECFACHTAEGGFALSFNTRQLNRDHAYPSGTANQITALADAGYLAGGPPAPATLPAHVPPADAGQPLERRVRSYLEVNCAQCHQPDGATTGLWDARSRIPLSFTGIINGRLTDNGGEATNRVIVPGDAAHSRLYHRISATSGSTRMPPIATREFDRAAEQLILEWIAALNEPQPASRILNLSGRALVGTGDDILIPGFVVHGSGPRRMLIRAVGPALAPFAVADYVPNPAVTLLAKGSVLGRNTGWNTAANATDIRRVSAEVGAFPLPEGGDDSAMLVTLDPGLYTAHLADANGLTGLALFEVYDVDGTNTARLVNTSVRARIGSGAAVTIPGLVVGPGAFKEVLIRAVGPGLAPLGVADHLARPVLTLHSGPDVLAENSGWSSTGDANAIAAASASVGAFALAPGSNDAAILATLSPGPYTLHVSSSDGAAGVALVEVYEVP